MAKDKKRTKDKSQLEEELQRTQEVMLDLETYIEEFTSFLPLPICSLNLQHNLLDVNGAFQKLTNYRMTELVGLPVSTVFAKKEEIDNLLKKVYRERKVSSREMTLKTKQGDKIPVSVSVSVRQDKEGDAVGFFLSITDITELKKFQEELEERVKEKTKDLQEKIEELERFNKMTIGRELKMVELKQNVTELQKEVEELRVKLRAAGAEYKR